MAGVTREGILQTTDGGGGASTSVAIGQPLNANDAAVLNTTPVGSEYGVAVRLVGATGGGGPATIANGADVNAGSTTDAAVITDTTGTLSGKLRGLVKWAFERMPTSLGQKVMTTSFPVVIASDQSTINTNATVAGTVAVSNFPATQAVTGPLTDAQLRATAVTVDIPTAVDVNIIGAGVPLLVNTKTNLNASAPTAVSVGTSSTAVLALNATRQGLVLVNTSNGIISIAFGTTAVLNSGITLLPYGVFCMDEYSCGIDAVNAIASVAASNLAVQEFTT